MKTIIWIRHGIKEYDNSKGPPGCYQHDSPLAPDQDDIIVNRGKFLIEKYGSPELCITSPFKRTRDTARLLTKDTDIPIEISTDVSEYLGNQKSDRSSIESITAEHNPPMNEKHFNLINRCSIHLSKMGVYGEITKSNVIWIVTHGIVIRTIAAQLNKIYRGIKLFEIGELEAFIFTKNHLGSELIFNNSVGSSLRLGSIKTTWDDDID